MKTIKITLLGIVMSAIVLFISANQMEDGDTNAVLMYLVVFSIPVIVLALLNAFYLFLIDKFLKGAIKVIGAFIPVLILAILAFQKNMKLPYLDGSLSFLAMVSAIGLGITCIVWAFSTVKKHTA